MTKRMLIDATHPEETRVAVVSGNRLEEYDYETVVRKQLKGNIYLVKVTRVEPSLQAAFVDFGGNRHGFLPFPEIHPDYYRIPIADREALIAEERAIAAAQAAREDEEDAAELAAAGESIEDYETSPGEGDDEEGDEPEEFVPQHTGSLAAEIDQAVVTDTADEEDEDEVETLEPSNELQPEAAPVAEEAAPVAEASEAVEAEGEEEEEKEPVDTVGGDVVEQPVFRSSIKRRYKIQEVIKRNQIMLIQISKEERGNKGAAVTSYISLPGRYCVLMPNSPRGGGVSRKVSNAKDRQRLKVILRELNVPEGMSVILRTAGVSRSTAEIKRDLDYLLRLWDQIRALTLQSTAPALIYEEGNLIKRAIRDLYRRDIEEVHVAGDEGFKAARDFMKTLMPSHVERVHEYKESDIPLFYRYQVENQIDAIHSPTVHLKSGGYIVINPTEAMVSIDVNSGRATKGRHIEETALKTNIEAAEEIARQLRLRDQGGLIVIDFIDMEDKRGNRIVEKKLRDAMQNDRARIQLGRISAFGLLELSRQRLHPSLVETNFEVCSHCTGSGLVRTVETSTVMLLRAIEEEGMKARASEIRVSVPTEIALYILNHKRDMLANIEKRYGIKVFLNADEKLLKPNFTIEAAKPATQEQQHRKAQRHAPVQSVDISDLPEIPESEMTNDMTVAEEERDFGGDDEGGNNNRHHGGGRNRNGGDREGRDDDRRRGRRGGRRRGGRGRDRDGDRGPRNFDGPRRDTQQQAPGEGPQPDYHPQPFDQQEGFVAEGGESGQPQENQGGERQGHQGREGGRRDRNRGGRGRNRHRNRNDRGPREQQGAADGAAQADNGGAQNFDAQDSAPAHTHHNENPAAHNDHGGGDHGGNDQTEGGQRRGWWKRLTE